MNIAFLNIKIRILTNACDKSHQIFFKGKRYEKKNIRIEMTHPAHFVHYTRIKYLLHSYAETSKRRHEFISCGLRSEKTQYRVSATALFGASFTGFLVWEISQIFYRETQDGEKSK